MRLGDYPAILAPGTKMYQLYKQTLGLTTEGPLTINERHRHRYEVNPKYHEILKKNGLMKRDPRMVERKKPGQPKARKKFQFSKR